MKTALLSVSDKRGVVELGRALHDLGVRLLSTGGTAAALRAAGLPVTEVATHTGAPEILDGRVKTLHPRVHGGLLGRPTDDHRREMAAHDIPPIDLLIVNLYPFAATIARPGVTRDEAIEQIDIGGPAMIRSASKNHERVTVLTDPADYEVVLQELRAHGDTTIATRRRLARAAFAMTAAYDTMIAEYLSRTDGDPAAVFPQTLPLTLQLQQTLRYGENPHQTAAFYRSPARPEFLPRASLADARVLQGKELSYNNLLDLDGALDLVLDLPHPAAAIIKHSNPCGAATDRSGLLAAYRAARVADPVSAFGGIVALSGIVEEDLAAELTDTFLECIVAPGYSDAARERLAKKPNLRVLQVNVTAAPARELRLRSVAGGVLVQGADHGGDEAAAARPVTKRHPSDEERHALDFAWRVCKHVKSNAIVLCRGSAAGALVVGVGAGQMSRVDSVKIAVDKAGDRAEGSVLASDAFFPFRDGLDVAARSGVRAVIQPGGSLRDAEVIAAADEQGVAMLMTQVRHFRH